MGWRTIAFGAAGAGGLLLLVVLGRAALAGFDPGAAPAALAPPVPLDLDRAARHLSQALQFRTVSHQDPAEDEAAAFDAQRTWIQTTYPAFTALASREVVGSGALLYTWRGARADLPPLVLMAHQDVVPVERPLAWRHAPFGGDIAEGAVWGRGALDDKGSLVAALEALETLAERGFRPQRTLILVSGAHEETTGAGIPEVAELLRRRDVHALFVLDEGLAILEKPPLTGRPVALVGVAEKGYATLKITARSAGGHAATPPPLTAAGALARAVDAVTSHPYPLVIRQPAEGLLQALAPEAPVEVRIALSNLWLFSPLVSHVLAQSPEGAALLHTTLAPTMLQGASKENVLPDLAVGRINIRILPGDRSSDVLARARRAAGALPVRLSFEGRPDEATPPASAASGAFRVIAALARDMEGVPTAPALNLFASDSRAMTPVATDILTFTFVRLGPGDADGVHGSDEHLSLANLRRLTEFYARLAATVGGG